MDSWQYSQQLDNPKIASVTLLLNDDDDDDNEVEKDEEDGLVLDHLNHFMAPLRASHYSDHKRNQTQPTADTQIYPKSPNDFKLLLYHTHKWQT